MMKYPYLLLFFFLSFFSASSQEMTDSLKKVHIVMNNGEEYTGKIIHQDGQAIILKTENGEMNLITIRIRSITPITYQGIFSYENPHKTRYFFGPTAIPLKKGKGYYQNLMLTTNFVNVGLTENISVGGGFEFISTFSGNPIWFFTPKVGFELTKNLYAGGGIFMIGIADIGSGTLGYGVVTYGTSDQNISAGVGYGFVDGSLSEHPSIMFSGILRVGNNIAILTENYFFPNSIGENLSFGIHGLRILSHKSSFDIGGMVFPGLDGVPLIPYAGYVRVF